MSVLYLLSQFCVCSVAVSHNMFVQCTSSLMVIHHSIKKNVYAQR